MLSVDEEIWWESLLPDIPYSLDATEHEKHALWEYLQGRTGVAEVAERIMVINPGEAEPRRLELEPIYGVQYSSFDKGESVVTLMINVALARPKLIPAILDLRDAIINIPNFDVPAELKEKYPEWRRWQTCAWQEFMVDIYLPDPQMDANLNALHAHEVTRDDYAGHPMRFGEHDTGFTEIILALEHDAWNHHSCDITILNDSVPKATPWIIIAGHRIFSYMNGGLYTLPYYGPANRIQREYGAASNLWHGKDNRSRERWDFWKQRLKFIQGVQVLTENTRVCAREAADKMDEIEKTN